MTIFNAKFTTDLIGTVNEMIVEIEEIFNKKNFSLISISSKKVLSKNRSSSYVFDVSIRTGSSSYSGITSVVKLFDNTFSFSEVLKK